MGHLYFYLFQEHVIYIYIYIYIIFLHRLIECGVKLLIVHLSCMELEHG